MIIENNSDNASPQKVISLSGTGKEEANPTKILDVTPSDSWNYGVVSINSWADKTFILENKGTAIILVSDIRLTGENTEDFSIVSPDNSNFSISSKSKKEITVRFNPNSEGGKVASLEISNDSENKSPVKKISLKGGVEISSRFIRLKPEYTLGFGQQKGTEPIYKTFTIENFGDATVSVYGIIIGGTDSLDYTIISPEDLSFQIPAGGSQQITVMFSPLSSSKKDNFRQATLFLNCDATNYDSFYNLLSLTGTDIEEYSNSIIKIYPNPTHQFLNIEFATMPDKYKYELFNNMGQCIIKRESSNRLEQINLNGITSGIYYLKIHNSDFLKTEKIIVK